MPLRHLLLALGLLAIAAPPSRAQAADVCDLGAAEADLDAGNVRATLYNIGGLFWRGREATYEVPKGTGIDAIYAAGLWLGGTVGDELRFAGSTYGTWEYWPGPLDATGAASAASCQQFDRIWVVSAQDLVDYRISGTPSSDLAAWPVGTGAPYYVDADGDGFQGDAEPTVTLRPGDAGYEPGRAIDLAAGERPVVWGAQTAWWIMNDRGGPHEWSETPSLGVEVRVTAWTVADRDRPDLTYTTAYRYDVLNRSGAAIEDVRAGFFADVDLGRGSDDYVHTDPDRSLVAVYNGDETDEGGGYGVPPALAIDVLSGADIGMHFFGGASAAGDPGSGAQAYNMLQARWADGGPLQARGSGYESGGDVTAWGFTGDPLERAFWSEENTDGQGRRNSQGDRRVVIGTDVGTLADGAETSLDVAVLFAQGQSRLASLERVRASSDAAQAGYADGSLFGVHLPTAPPPPPPAPNVIPELIGPADGVAFGARPVTFDWTPVSGADGYVVEFSTSSEFFGSDGFLADAPPFELAPEFFVPNRTEPVYWRVVPTNGPSVGPASAARAVTLYRYEPGPLLVRGGPAFVEVVGPGGIDPCGPGAGSTGGCTDVFGNLVYRSLNSTRDYVLADVGVGTEASIGAFAPNDFELRFTAGGSFAYYPATGALIAVPFEVWDVGTVAPGEANDPADDVRLIPTLVAEPPEEGAEPVVCTFGYVGPTEFSIGATTQQISAVYGDYAAFAAEAGALVAADPDGCPDGPATDAAWAFADPGRGTPIRALVAEQMSDRGVETLEGAVVRFYTLDRQSVSAEDDAPTAATLGLAVFPNPSAGAATVRFEAAAAGPVRLRVVDVLGREVATLLDGDRPAGAQSVAFDAGALAPGLYVVVLDAAGQRTTRTVTVVR